MRERRGFALAAVLTVLIIMSMVVAVRAQRALITARQGVLDLAQAEIEAAVAEAQVELLAQLPDSTAALPGVVLANGETAVGAARARWTVSGAASPFAMATIEGEAPSFSGVARSRRGALLLLARDSAGAPQWRLAEGAGWARMPSP